MIVLGLLGPGLNTSGGFELNADAELRFLRCPIGGGLASTSFVPSSGDSNGFRPTVPIAAGCGIMGPRGELGSGLSKSSVLGGSGSEKGSLSSSAMMPANVDWEETLPFFLRKTFRSPFLLE